MIHGKKAQFDEFMPEALAIAMVIWLLFLVMVLKIPTWKSMSGTYKVIMLGVAIPLFYGVAAYMINRE